MKAVFLLLALLIACSPKFENRNVYVIKAKHKNGQRKRYIVELPNDDHVSLQNNCLIYGKEKKLLCNISKYKCRKLK